MPEQILPGSGIYLAVKFGDSTESIIYGASFVDNLMYVKNFLGRETEAFFQRSLCIYRATGAKKYVEFIGGKCNQIAIAANIAQGKAVLCRYSK